MSNKFSSNTEPEHKKKMALINEFLYLHEGTVRYKKGSGKYAAIKRKAGDPVHSSLTGGGYHQVCFGGIQMFLHAIVFALVNGYVSTKNIDHINNNKSDNHPNNLRECTCTENNWNQSIRKSNTSGIKNVRWHGQRNKWVVSLRTKYGRMSFGLYSDLELAALVAESAMDKYHGKFARK